MPLYLIQCPILLKICNLVFQLGRLQFFCFDYFFQIVLIQPKQLASLLYLIPGAYTDFLHPHPRQSMYRYIAALLDNPIRLHNMFYPPLFYLFHRHTGQFGNIDTLRNQSTYPHTNKKGTQSCRNFFFPFHPFNPA